MALSIVRLQRACALLLVLAVPLVACSGGSTAVTPVVSPAPTTSGATPSPTPHASATPSTNPTATPMPTPTATPTPPAGTTMQSGTIVVPSGVNLSLAALRVANSVAAAMPVSNGSFGLSEYGGAPQFTTVTDANGNLVLAGFFGTGETTIDSLSTAKLLAFYAADLYTLPSPYRSDIVDELPGAPGFSSVQNAVIAALRAHPAGLQSDAGVASALASFVTALYAPGDNSAAAREVRTASRVRDDVVVSPSNASGIAAIDDFPDGVHLVNSYRRSAEAFIDRDSYVDTNGQRIPAAVTDFASPLPILSTSGLSNVTGSLVAAIRGYFSGATAYVPVATPDIPLPNMPNALSTRYLITIVGAGAPNPAIPLRAEELSARQRLGLTQLLQDFIIPLVTSVAIPLKASAIDSALKFDGGSNTVSDLVSFLLSSSSGAKIVNEYDAGMAKQALHDTLTEIGGSSTAQALVFQFILLEAEDKFGPASAEQFFDSATKELNRLNILSGALVTADVTAVATAIVSSNGADRFRVDATTDKVSLTPPKQSVAEGAATTLTANVFNADRGDAFAYTYTNSAKFGHLTDGLTGHLDNFTSSRATVTYTANATATGTDAVNVGIALIQGQQRAPIGKAAAIVTVTALQPAISLSPSGCHNFGTSGGSLTYTATATNVPAGTKTLYGWAFGSSGPNPPDNVTFSDPGATIDTQLEEQVGPSNVVSIDVAPDDRGGGVANESLQVQLFFEDANGNPDGPDQFVAAHAYFSFGSLSCQSTTAVRGGSRTAR